MAAGEQKFSSRSMAVKRFTNTPIPKGIYPFELLKDGMQVKTSAENPENSIPRIGVRFAAQGTAKDGGKDRLYFHDFYLSLKPGKDTVVMPARGGQLIEFARAQGDELDDITLQEKTITVVEDGEEKQVKVKYLDPGEVMEYLESKVGTVTEGKLTIEAEQNRETNEKYPIDEAHPGRNKMEHWQLDEAKLNGEGEDEDEKPAPKSTKPASSLPKKKK